MEISLLKLYTTLLWVFAFLWSDYNNHIYDGWLPWVVLLRNGKLHNILYRFHFMKKSIKPTQSKSISKKTKMLINFDSIQQYHFKISTFEWVPSICKRPSSDPGKNLLCIIIKSFILPTYKYETTESYSMKRSSRSRMRCW